MKDMKYVIGFIVLGLVLAYALSGPLRKSASQGPKVGTPLRSSVQPYAEGIVEIAPELASRVKDAAALFLIVKTTQGGPPIAVRKYNFPTLPLEFSLTQEHNMAGDDFYDGDIKVTARLDKDGIAGPFSEGDYETAMEINKGQPRNVSLILGK